MSGWLDLSQ